MRTSEFLRKVLPDEGYLIVATPPPTGKKSGWWNNVVNDVPELQVKATEWLRAGKDVYFAMSSYKEKQVWSPTKIDYKTKLPGAWEKRTQANVRLVRSLFLDLDVDPKNAEKYSTQKDAAIALTAFCKTTGLPTPMMVDSGYGIHVYWPFTEAVPRATWQVTAEKLKSVCVVLGLKADHGCTSDAARVLRVPGTQNFKRGSSKPVVVKLDAAAHDIAILDAALSQYVAANNVPVDATKAHTPLSARTGPTAGVEGNIGATNDPLNGNALVFNCPAMGKLVANRGATASYPHWLAGLSLARYCDDPKLMALAVSDGHPQFNAQETTEKMGTLTTGPAKCATFWKFDNDTCENCLHWTNIRSPSQVGRPERDAAAVAVPIVTVTGEKIPPMPPKYKRTVRADGSVFITYEVRNDEGQTEDQPVCDYDLYPARIMEQTTDEEESEERSVWVAHLPRIGRTEWKMPQSILSDPRKLHAFLLSRGLHVNPKEAKSLQFYMTAYLKSLAKEVDRERMYEHLGWHEKHKVFVMPNTIYHPDGTVTSHVPSKALDAITKSAFHSAGTLEGWKNLILFYKGEQYYGTRFMMDCTYGSPLLWMTGLKGVLIAAAGDTGRGKTTTLQACMSIYGDPTNGLVGGGKHGTTINALFHKLGTLHSLPMFWDDTTERDPEEMREFMLHIPAGMGKDRMYGNQHDGKVILWETLVISSTNTDDVHRIMAAGKDSAPHLMRFISVPFDVLDRSTEAKLRADIFIRGIKQNFGVAGEIILPYYVKHRDKINDKMIREMERFDRKLQMPSEERHWTATFAAAHVGGRIAHALGISPFDPRDDEEWRVEQVVHMRSQFKEASSTSADILSEYLEQHIANTLILSPKQTSHVDNIVNRPQSSTGLKIRHEVDNGLIYVAKPAFQNYCTEVKANFTRIEAELQLAGIILRKHCYKVLGADTPFAIGQSRCWEISRDALQAVKRKKP